MFDCKFTDHKGKAKSEDIAAKPVQQTLLRNQHDVAKENERRNSAQFTELIRYLTPVLCMQGEQETQTTCGSRQAHNEMQTDSRTTVARHTIPILEQTTQFEPCPFSGHTTVSLLSYGVEWGPKKNTTTSKLQNQTNTDER
eukprot:1911154-Amphidinium_carterae.1